MTVANGRAPLTVGDLAVIEALHSEVIAGSGGAERPVLWAHSCENTRPWQWLNPGDVLMTLGLCVPSAAAEQVEFIRALDDAGLSAVMLGDHHDMLPPVSDEMLAEADRRDFPVLLTEPQVSFAAVTHHVSAANASSQATQVLTLAKLYEAASERNTDAQLFVDKLSRLLKVGLEAVDTETGLVVMRTTSTGAGAPRADRRRTHTLGSGGRAELTTLESFTHPLSALTLVHLQRIIEVEVDRIQLGVSRWIDRSHRALRRVLIESNDASEAKALLEPFELESGYRVAVAPLEHLRRLSAALGLENLRVLVGEFDDHGVLLIPTRSVPAVRALTATLAIAVGVSARHYGLEYTRSALSEAESAHATLAAAGADAARTGGAWIEYEGVRIDMLARSKQEALDIVASVLGPLAERTGRAATLRATLFTYLRADRSWKRSAEELGIHRQTLAYRLRSIEASTGRVISRTEDLAALWVAARAWAMFCDD